MKRTEKMMTGTNAKSNKAKRLNGMLALAVAGLVTPHAFGDATWTGATDSNWDNVNNWSAPPTGNLQINNTTNPGVYPVVTATPVNVTPTDIRIGTGGLDGRLDVLGGTLSTGLNNWLFLGYQGGQATLNLANTAATGGTLTGFGQGSGSLTAGGANANGNFLLGLDANTRSILNINTTGTVSGGGMFLSGAGASTATVNLDSGNIVLGGEMQVGGSFYGNGNAGTLNMSGGTITSDLFTLSRGTNAAAAITGTANVTGGTINAKRYFTLGFAGSASTVATVNNTGGTINVNTANGGGILEMGVYDATVNTFNANTGSVNLQNNSSIVFGSGGNHSGTSTFNQNGGTVTFYSDGGTTVGGTGSINLGNGNSTGTYAYNLNGGTLTVGQIRKSGANANGSFNFNGGTLAAAADSTAFLGGLSNATVQSGGATINTNGHNVTVAQNLNGSGNVTKTGAGVLTLANSQDYNGATTVGAGNLRLTPNNNYNTSGTTVASGATLSTAGVAGNTILTGSLTQSNGGSIDLRNGAADTLFVSNGLTLRGGSLGFDVGSTADNISLTGGAFSLSGTNNVFLANLGGAAAGSTYSLLTGASGLSLSNFSLQTPTVAGFAASLSVVGGSTLQLTLGQATAALTAYYNVNGSANFVPASFSASANGTGAVNAIGTATAVTFSSTPATSATAKTVTLTANQGVKSIVVSDTGAVTLTGASTLTVGDASGITVNGGAGAFSLNTAGVALDVSQTWTNNSANAVKVNAVISGGGRSLGFAGPGAFVLTGANTYDGATTIGSGTTLQLGDGTAGRDGSIASTSGVTNNGTLVYNRGGTANTAAYAIGGSGSVTVTGTGSQALTGVNTYTGGTTVNGGTVIINSASSLGDASGALNLNNGTLETTANINTARAINLGSANSTIQTDGNTTYNVTNVVGGTGALNKSGAGTVNLTAANTYSGGTVVNAGTVGFASAPDANTNLGTGNVTVNTGGTLRAGYGVTSNVNQSYTANNITLNGGSIYADDAFQHLTGNLVVTTGGNLGSTYNAGDARPAESDKGLYLDGVVSGSGALNLQQSGISTGNYYNTSIVHFTNGANTYSGTVTVTPMTGAGGGSYLGLSSSTALQSATVNLPANNAAAAFGNSPLVFKSGIGSATLGGLSGNANVVLSGYDEANHFYLASENIALSVGRNNANTTFAGVMSGDGSLTKVGTGTLTVTGANTYTGVTTVIGGTLKAAGGAITNVLSNAGGLDVQSSGRVVLDYTGGTSPVAQVKSILDSEYAANFASGQIRSTGLAAGRTIGYGDNGVDSVTLRLTLPGDSNLDGTVNFNDFLILQNNFGKTGTRFDQGNFNYDGATNFNDFLVLQNNFGKSIGSGAPSVTAAEYAEVMSITSASEVPEPASLTLIGLGAAGLLRRRRVK